MVVENTINVNFVAKVFEGKTSGKNMKKYVKQEVVLHITEVATILAP